MANENENKNIYKVKYGNVSDLTDLATDNGALIFTKDKGNLYVDLDDTRYQIKDDTKLPLNGAALAAKKLVNYDYNGELYKDSDTHYLKLGYWKTDSSTTCTLLVNSDFYHNIHGSFDIIQFRQNNASSTSNIYCSVSRIALDSSTRKFYYVEDKTNKRVYLYVYVTGGNGYGTHRISVIQNANDAWVTEFASNQTLENQKEIGIYNSSFGKVSINDSNKFSANQVGDSINFVGGSNVTLTPDTDNKKITIAAKDTTYSTATTSANGLMTSAMVTKLDGIETGANKTVVDSSLSSTSTNPVQNKIISTTINSLKWKHV